MEMGAVARMFVSTRKVARMGNGEPGYGGGVCQWISTILTLLTARSTIRQWHFAALVRALECRDYNVGTIWTQACSYNL
jgi:hypothetical protein